MKMILLFAFLPCMSLTVLAQSKTDAKTPLSKYSKEWDNPRYKACNSAANARYMTRDEQEIIWVLNMARANPQLFQKTILARADEIAGINMSNVVYFKTLDSTMKVMKPLNILKPDSMCARGARLHAEGSGKTGYTGHVRQTPESKKAFGFNGECCSYGTYGALKVVLRLLVDEDVPSLGHRDICLSSYTKIGVGIAPHSSYGTNAVLDFVRK